MPAPPNDDVTACLELLFEKFPLCFHRYEARRRPLALKIHERILAEFDGALTPQDLSRSLAVYCSNAQYLRACCQIGASRVALDGTPAGVVSADESHYARQRLIRLKSIASDALREPRAASREGILTGNRLTIRDAQKLIAEKLPRRRERFIVERKKSRWNR
jgi:ProP effector